jgi:hypothetical protein
MCRQVGIGPLTLGACWERVVRARTSAPAVGHARRRASSSPSGRRPQAARVARRASVTESRPRRTVEVETRRDARPA